MRTDFSQLIETESAKLQALHVAVHRTVATRDRDHASRVAWEQACKEFHSYASPMGPYLKQACEEKQYSDKELIEFAVCFVEIDPVFFRSGYLKQILITRLKRSDLREPAKRRLRSVLVDAVNRRGSREFRYYCRLAAQIADAGLVEQLRLTVKGEDRTRARRAQMMLKQIDASAREHGVR